MLLGYTKTSQSRIARGTVQRPDNIFEPARDVATNRRTAFTGLLLRTHNVSNEQGEKETGKTYFHLTQAVFVHLIIVLGVSETAALDTARH